MRAALRLGAFQLVFLDGVPRYAAVNESVELVRRARLERAVPFTNAVLRRLADEGRARVEALPDATWQEAALAHSYPDWVAETWWRDLGAEGARALMRAQNEAPPTVVRLVRGEIEGAPDPDVPGAWHVEHVDERALAEGRIWPQSSGSQLAGPLRSARRPASGCSTSARRPAARRRCCAGEVVAVEANAARARELEENVRRLGATNVAVVCADGRALPDDLTGFDRALVDAPCSGLGVLAARPDLRWRSQPLPELQLELLPAAAARVRPGGTIVYSVCTVNRDEAEAVVDAAGLAVDHSLAEAWPQFRHRSAARVPADAAARARHERVLHRAAPRAVSDLVTKCHESWRRSGVRIAAWAGSTWIRDEREVAPSLYAADFTRLGEQIDALLGAGCRIFHFDVGDGHFVPPVTIGPVVLRSIAPMIHEAGGVLDCHLMVADPAHHFAEFAESGADSVTFHVEASDDPGGVAAAARALGLAVGVAFNPRHRGRRRRRVRRARPAPR